MANAQEISIPVRLDVLKASISNLQHVLDSLQPNTSNWKALSKIISQMTTEAQKLQAQVSTPFSSQKQFAQTEQTIDKLEQTAARVKVVMESIQFSDLKLTPAQTAEFQKFQQEIDNIRNSYKQLQDEVKNSVLKIGNNASLLSGINVNAVNSDFEQIKSAVDKHVADLNAAVDKQQEAFDKLKQNVELGMRATTLTSSEGGLTREALGDTIFDKFLSEKNGIINFKGGTGLGRANLMRAIEEEFKLEPGQLQALAQGTYDQINAAFQKLGASKANPFDSLIKAGNRGTRGQGAAYTELENLKTSLKEYQALQTELNRLKNEKLDPAASVDTGKIAEIEQKMGRLRDTILSGITANSSYTSSMQTLMSQFPQLRTVLESTNAQFLKMQQITNTFNAIKMTIANFMGFTQVLNLTKRAVKEAANHIKELDSVMNKISIVTNMSTSDLWGQMDKYSEMAQKYGASIKGAYEVSQIYYQQGLDTKEVMTLTNETLKLAKISGLDYAASTDYMTTALRGFKMEMADAATVVDVYSNLAANTAVSQEELAVAMSKTASSMESVGATFQEASAMIATMVAVTRESSTNIGSAMKSIASRYGEMKSDPTKMTDSEGEDMDFNKVDTALKSVGITMKTVDGQFRDFTDVIIELGEKWDQLESTQQRYIATQFAGNRQQSRFLALVSNVDLLKSNLDYAMNSEDTGTMQALKALDSLESKIEQVRVAYQQFYTTIGIESVWKGFLDGTKNVINTLNRMPKLFGTLPVGALNAIINVISVIKSLALKGLQSIAKAVGTTLVDSITSQAPQAQAAGENWFASFINGIRAKMGVARATGQEAANAVTAGAMNSSLYTAAANSYTNRSQVKDWSQRISQSESTANPAGSRYDVATEMQKAGVITSAGFQTILNGGPEAIAMLESFKNQIASTSTVMTKLGGGLTGFGQALNIISLAINTTTQGGKRLSGVLQTVAGVAITAGAMIKMAGEATKTIPWMAIASGVLAVINGISMLIQANSLEAQLEELTERAETLGNKAKELKANYRTLETSSKKIKELEKSRYDSAEAAEEYQEAVDNLAEAFPDLISGYDAAGNAIINAVDMEGALTTARQEAAEAALAAAQAEARKAEVELEKNKEDIKNKGATFANAEKRVSNGGSGYADGSYIGNYDALAKLHKKKQSQQLTADEQLLYDHLYDLLYSDNTEPVVKHRDEILAGTYTSDQYGSWSVNANMSKLLDSAVKYGNRGNYDEASHLIKIYEQWMDLQGYSWTDEGRKKLNEWQDEMRESQPYARTVEASHKKAVNSWLWQSDYSDIPMLQNTGMATLVQDKLYDMALGNNNFTEGALENYASEILGGLSNFWATLSDYQKERLGELWEHPEKYTNDDFYRTLKEIGLEGTSGIPGWALNIFEENSTKNKSRLSSKAQQIYGENYQVNQDYVKWNEIFGEGSAQISLDESRFLTSALSQVETLKEQGLDSSDFVTDILAIYKQMAKLPAEARNSLIEQFVANGFTKEGLTKTKKYISENEDLAKFNIDPIDNIMARIIPNLVMSTAAVTEEFTSKWKDIDKKFSSFSKGVSFEELDKTIKEAKALGINVSMDDFVQSGDKWILKADKFASVVDDMSSQYTEQFEGQAEALDKAYTEAKKQGNNNPTANQHLEERQLVLGSHFTDVYTQATDGTWGLKADSKYVTKTNKYWDYARLMRDNDRNAGRTEGLDEAMARLEHNSGLLQTEEDIQAARRIFHGMFDQMYQYSEEQQGYILTDYAKEEVLRTNDEYQALVDECYTSGKDSLTALSEFFETMSEQLKKTEAWRKGDYTSLTTLGLGDTYATVEAAYKRIKELATGAATMTDDERLQPDVKAAVENYQKGYSTLLSDLTSKGTKYVSDHIKDYEGISEADLEAFKEGSGKSYVELVRTASTNAGKIVAEINADVAAAIEKQNGLGRQKSTAGLVSGGFTATELASYLEEIDPTKLLSEFINDSGELVGPLAEVFEYDAETGGFKRIAGKSMEDVNAALEAAFGEKIEEDSKLYRDLAKEAVEESIKDAEDKDTVKKSMTQLASVAGAKVGDRIDVSDVNETIRNKLTDAGLEITDNYVHITSQQALNDAILALEELANDPNLTPQEKGQISKLVSDVKSKYSKSSALTNMIAETVTADVAQVWAVIVGKENDVAGAMKDLGYTWSDSMNAYVSGANSIVALQQQISELEASSDANDQATVKKINELRAKLNTLATSAKKKNVDSINEILTNYNAVSEEMITNLADSLDKPREEIIKYFKSRGDGTYAADLSQIIADIENGVLTVQDGVVQLLSDSIEQAMNSYLSQFETAIDNAGASGKNSEIQAKAMRIYSQMSEDERTQAGVTSAKDLMEWSSEQGGYRLNETGRQFEISQAEKANTEWADVEKGFIESLLRADMPDDFVETYMEAHGISAEYFDELSSIFTDFKTRTKKKRKASEIKQVRQEMIAEVDERVANAQAQLVNDMADAVLPTLAEFDFEGIAAGTITDEAYTKARLKELLTQAQVTIEDATFDAAYEAIKDGDWSQWDLMVQGTKAEGILSTDTLGKIASANYSQYTTALEEAYTKPVEQWSEATKQLQKDLLQEGETSISRETFISRMHGKLDTSAFESATDRSERHRKYQEWSGGNTQEALYEMVSGGSFSENDLLSFMQTNMPTANIEDYWDFATHSFKDAAMAAKWQYNAATRQIEAVATDSATWLEDAWAQAGTLFDTTVDTTSDEAKAALRKAQEDLASKLNENNVDIYTAEDIKSFAEMEVGKWVSIYSLPAELQEELGSIEGIQREGSLIKATTETARVAAIRKLGEKSDTIDADLTQSHRAIEDAVAQVEEQYNRGETIASLISSNVSMDTARTMAIIEGWGESKEAIDEHMTQLGFAWDNTALAYIHQGESFEELGNLVQSLDTDTRYSEEFAREQSHKLTEFREAASKAKQQYDALSAVLSNVDNVSEDSILALENAFGTDLSSYFEIDETTKQKSFKLRDFLSNAGSLSDFWPQVLKSIAPQLGSTFNDIIKEVSGAADYAFKGTQDQQAIEEFKKEYEKVTGESAEDIFHWEDLTQSWILDITALNKYKAEKLQELIGTGMDPEDAQAVVDNLTKMAAAQAVDVSTFLEADNRSATSNAYKTLKKQLVDYYAQTGVELSEADVAAKIAILEKGGDDAIDLVKSIAKDAGVELSDADLQSYYAPMVTRLIKYRDAIADLVVGQYVPEGDLRNILSSVGMVDSTGLVTSVDNLAAAYLAIYAQMTDTATTTGATLKQKNETYAKYLTAKDQKAIDTMNTLQEASGMGYDTFATLLSNYEHDIMEVMADASNWGVQSTGFGQVRITDFNKFASKMGWSLDSPEYASAYSDWVDSMIELQNMPATMMQNAADELQGLTEAKVGQGINVSYLQKTLGEGLGSLVNSYGATLHNGILTISENTDVPGLIQAIAEEAADAGALIPEQLAELADAVAEMISQITSLITGGISGTLSHSEANQLSEWANKNGIGQLDFTETAEGLKLSTKSAIELTQKMRELNSIQGQIAFTALTESLIEADDRFKSVQSQTAYMAKLTRDISYEANKANIQANNGRVEMFDRMMQNGNVDLYNRPKLDWGNGDYSTLLTTTLDSRNFESNIPWVMNITPIPPDASSVEDIMSDAEIDEYIQGILDKNPIDATAMLDWDKVENGGKGLIIELKQVDEVTDEIAENMGEAGDELHEVSEAFEAIKEGETFDSTKIEQYQQELELAQEIMRVRSTTEDDSFKFMEQSIPSGQNNPLNYWENWAKAYEAINNSMTATGAAKGHMKYQDFYNMVTEMGNLAETTGHAIEFGGQTLENAQDAANLIERAAGALNNVDGTLQVDLSGIGVDFASGAEGMADSVDQGIHDLAQSQVDMLDSMISLLETIVAMEALGDLDVNGDMEISVPEILLSEDGKTADGRLDETGQWIEQYGSKYKATRQKIIDSFTGDDGELQGALTQVTANGHTMAEILSASESQLKDWGIKAQDLSTLLTNLYKISQSNDFDVDRPWESFLEIFQGLDWGDLVIGANAGNHQIILTDEGTYSIDYTSDAAIAKIKGAMPEWADKSKEEISKEVQAIIDAKNAGQEITARQDYLLHVLTGDIKVITDKDGKTTYKVGDASYDSWEDAAAASDIFKIDSDQKIEVEGGVAKGSITLSEGEIEITSTGDGKVTFTFDGQTYTSKEEAYQAAYKKMTGEDATADSDGAQKETEEYRTWKAKEGLTIVPTISVNGQSVDIQNNPEVRAAIENIRNSTDEQIESMLSEAGGDKYTMELENGVVVSFDAEDITVNGQVDASKVRAKLAEELGLDTALAGTITEGIKGAFGEGGIPLDNLKITPQTTTVDGEVVVEPIDTASGEVVNLKVKAQNTEAEGSITDAQISAMLESTTVSVTVDKETAITDLQAIATEASTVESSDPTVDVKETEDPSGIANKLKDIWTNADKVSGQRTASVVLSGAEAFKTGIQTLIDKVKELAKEWKVTFKAEKTGTWPAKANGWIAASGNVGRAMASGGTLMGELGPELVVQQGRYFVAGQAGAEFVDLAPDAIVFNHLQTEQLLKNGMSSERGRAVTNERVAAAYAHGNMNGGPAMASASAALAALKQLKAMWESLLNASVKDLAGAGGSGGGGGGNNAGSYGHFIEELEKWYNWLQKIAELETKINYEEARRSKIASDMIPHGQDYVKSQLRSLDALKQELDVQKDLVASQEDYFAKRVKDLNDVNQNPFATLYTFDEETGQLQYQNGKLEELSKLVGTDKYGKANYDTKAMYEEIVKMNPELENYMKYDSNGELIDFYEKDENGEYKKDENGNKIENKDAYTTAVQAFWDKMDADKEEMQSLHDSINEHKEAILEEQEAMNEILKEMEDNQISVENKVLKALEDSRQRAIDDAKDERDAIEEASNSLIDGLSTQLQKERDMYSKQQSSDELSRLQRQLGILQRSGGSAASIASLEAQIADKMKNAYFDAQQEEIDKLQEATDAQLERLDHQITIMEESLAYEKENGLLWTQVYEEMAKSPEEIAQYIADNDSSLWGQSPTKSAADYRDMLYEAQQYTEFRDSVEGGLQTLIQQLTDTNDAGADPNAGSGNEGDNGGGDNGNNGNEGSNGGSEGENNTTQTGTWKQNETGWWYEHADGSYTKNDWEKIDDKWYHFDDNGYMQTGWVKDGNKWYYLNSDGSMRTAPLKEQKDQGYVEYTFDPETGEMIREIRYDKNGKPIGGGGSGTNAYDTGGMVEKDEMALLHAHEGVLTAQQTDILRNDILGRSKTSLMNLLLDFRDAYEGLGSSSGDIPVNDAAIIIEQASVNMNVEQLANDYDAQRAGQRVMDEMLRIAKKTKGWNRIGR